MSDPQPGLIVTGGATTQSSGPGSGDLNYLHVQSVSSTVWVVQHNLGKYPSITVLDTNGDEVWCDVRHNSTSQITLNFSIAFAGTAVCN